jgi:phosphohistidine swiveling domain-containing protein/ketosteroid isomerase-like protein
MPFYTRANAGEVLPDPASPLGWTLVFEQGLLPGWLRGMIEFGIYREGELDTGHPPVVGSFGGYFYINLSHCRVMAIRMGMTVEAFDAALLGNAAAAPPYRPHPQDPCQECSATVGQTIGEILAADEFPQIEADLERVLARRRGRPELAALPAADLVAYARSFLPELDNAFARHDYSTLGSAVGPAMLAQACAAAGQPQALLDLISGYGEVPSASPSWGLWRLSRLPADSPEFAAALSEFLADFGQRGPNEWDIRAVSWEAGPDQVLALVDSMRPMPDEDSPDARHLRLEATRVAAAARIRSMLPDEASRQSFDVALRSAARTIPLREKTKLIAVTTINEVRMAMRELGRRGVASGYYAAPEDVMMLLESELDDYVADPARFAPVIAGRLAQYLALFELEPPFIIDADPAPLGEWARRSRPRPAAALPGDVLRGVGGSAGRYQGRARVGLDLPAALALEPGEILVAPITDAAWTPLFLVAGAVVVDVGALNSHAVVVSRELGIPCVLSVQDATARLRDGMLLAVDGTAGTVTVVSGLLVREGMAVVSELQVLADKQEITEICYRYGLALDARDWAALAGLFTPDADAYYMNMPPCHGYEAIEDTVRAALTPMSATQHLISNVVVRLDGDRAESTCYLQAQHVKTGTEGGDNFIIAGRYDDQLVRGPDGWRIRERKLTSIWTDGNPGVGQRRLPWRLGGARVAV